MKTYLLLVLCCLSMTSRGQINQTLKKELDSLYTLDQKYRDAFMIISSQPELADSIMTLLKIKDNGQGPLWTLSSFQNHIDSLNLIRIGQIIRTNGYPGTSLVGSPTNEVAWSVIQHSPEIRHYFPLIRQAGQAKEIPFPLVAMMQDRLLTQQHKSQIYGTQGACYSLKNTASKHHECFMWPVINPKGVNKRRKRAGFSDTIEEYANGLNISYRVMSLKFVLKNYNLGNSN